MKNHNNLMLNNHNTYKTSKEARLNSGCLLVEPNLCKDVAGIESILRDLPKKEDPPLVLKSSSSDPKANTLFVLRPHTSWRDLIFSDDPVNLHGAQPGLQFFECVTLIKRIAMLRNVKVYCLTESAPNSAYTLIAGTKKMKESVIGYITEFHIDVDIDVKFLSKIHGEDYTTTEGPELVTKSFISIMYPKLLAGGAFICSEFCLNESRHNTVDDKLPYINGKPNKDSILHNLGRHIDSYAYPDMITNEFFEKNKTDFMLLMDRVRLENLIEMFWLLGPIVDRENYIKDIATILQKCPRMSRDDAEEKVLQLHNLSGGKRSFSILRRREDRMINAMAGQFILTRIVPGSKVEHLPVARTSVSFRIGRDAFDNFESVIAHIMSISELVY